MSVTTHLSLQTGHPSSTLPTSVKACSHPEQHLEHVISAICHAKRVVVVCGTCRARGIAIWTDMLMASRTGAGVSVGAGIPDFRSSNGLFNTVKRNNSSAGLTSGKDLFHARVFEVCFSLCTV